MFFNIREKTKMENLMSADEKLRKQKINFYQKFFKEASEPEGAVLFGVLRGKGSEGIDFSDKAARGVFIIGIPFPVSPTKDLKVKLKMYYLDDCKKKYPEDSISGEDWYNIQAAKSINQGIGRVLRHRNDYGVVGLIDSRFCDKPLVCNNLSKWAKEVMEIDRFEVFSKKVSLFFEKKNNSLPKGIDDISNNLEQKLLDYDNGLANAIDKILNKEK